jgi:hypothetical protein
VVPDWVPRARLAVPKTLLNTGFVANAARPLNGRL